MTITAAWMRDQAAAYLRAADRLDQQTPPVRRGETMGVNCAPTGDAFSRVSDLGFRWVRISDEAHWHTDGRIPYDWTGYDRAIALAHSFGLKVIQACQGMPATMAVGGKGGHYPPKDCQAMLTWADWTAECAARGADCIEVGNEWNHPTFWAPEPDPAASATLTAFAADAIKRRAPDVTVITGGLAPAGGPLAPPAFLAAQLAAAPPMLDHVDGVGHHPYQFPGDPRQVHGDNAVAQTRLMATTAQRPVWATEWGSSVRPDDPKGMTEDDQVLHTAAYLDAFDALEASGVTWGVLVWYCLDDRPDKPADWASWMGLYRDRSDWRPVAELLALRAAELVP